MEEDSGISSIEFVSQEKGFNMGLQLYNKITAHHALSACKLSFIMLITYMIFVCSKYVASSGDFLIGIGSYDITGPAADVNFMGYASPSQNGAGIHFRLRARTFVVASRDDDRTRFAFVNVDACMGSDLVTLKVLESLKNRFLSLIFTA